MATGADRGVGAQGASRRCRRSCCLGCRHRRRCDRAEQVRFGARGPRDLDRGVLVHRASSTDVDAVPAGLRRSADNRRQPLVDERAARHHRHDRDPPPSVRFRRFQCLRPVVDRDRRNGRRRAACTGQRGRCVQPAGGPGPRNGTRPSAARHRLRRPLGTERCRRSRRCSRHPDTHCVAVRISRHVRERVAYRTASCGIPA